MEDGETDLLRNKFARFELNIESNITWAFEPNLAEYAKKFIQKFVPTETFTGCIIDKIQVPTNMVK